MKDRTPTKKAIRKKATSGKKSAVKKATSPEKVHPEGLPELDTEELRIVFDIQKQNIFTVKNKSASERIQKLDELKRAILRSRKRLKTALYNDFRKPEVETDATEILPVLLEIQHFKKNLSRWMSPMSVSRPLPLVGTRSIVYHEAKGVVLIISPWNYPVTLLFRPLVAAIAAGNCVVLKPSEHAPSVSVVVREIISEVFPENEVAVAEGGVRVSKDLLTLPFNHIYYTGNPAIGKEVMRKAAEHLASVTLELGGKSPTIVDETADLRKAAQKILMGKFANAGQTCIAPDYILVRDTIKDSLLDHMREVLYEFYGDVEGIASNEDYTAIVNDKHYNRLMKMLLGSLKHGTALITRTGSRNSNPAAGNNRAKGNNNPVDRVIPPTIIDGVTDTDPLMKDEIFGPLLPIIAFADLAEAIEYINGRENPLALYIFSKDRRKVDWIIRNTSAGTTAVNETLYQYVNPWLPFGGAGFSGIGKGNGLFAFSEFSNARSVLDRRFDTISVQPPYNDKIKRLVNFLIGWYSR